MKFFTLYPIFLVLISFVVKEPIFSLQKEETYFVILEPKQRTQLSSQIFSPVQKIRKKMGDKVKKGEILIELDSTVFQAEYLMAKSALEKASVQLEARKALFEDGSASLFELKEAEALAAKAHSDLIQSEDNLKKTKILAPYNGKIVFLFVEEHETPKIGEDLIELIEDENLTAKFLVRSDSQIALEESLSIFIKETGEMIPANISRIAPDIDPSSATIKVEAEIDNSRHKWKAGMSGVVHLEKIAAAEPFSPLVKDEEEENG